MSSVVFVSYRVMRSFSFFLAVLLLAPTGALAAKPPAPASQATQPAQSAPPPKKDPMAVLDVMTTGVPADQAQLLTELVASEVQSLGQYTVLTGQDITAGLSVGGSQLQVGCTDTQCLIDIGLALGVRMILATHVGHIGTTHVVNIKLIDVKATRTEKRLYETVEGGAETLLPTIRHLVRKVLDAPPEAVSASRHSSALSLVPSTTTDATSTSTLATSQPVVSATDDSQRALSSWIPLSIGAVGAAGVGVGAFFGLRALNWKNKANEDNHPGRQIELDQASRSRRNANIAYSVGATALVVAAVSWYLLDTPADEASAPGQ